MRDLVSEPEWNQLGVEAQSLGFRVGNAGKMLETDKSYPLPVDYQFARIGGTYTDHQYDIDVGIDIQQGSALLFRISGEGDDVDPLQHGAKVHTACKCGRANDFQKMWPRRIEDVVVPVGL
jgi:hypothetical protein